MTLINLERYADLELHRHYRRPVSGQVVFLEDVLDVLLFFFFQAEDGIRDVAVTGVQTCALPICVMLRLDAGVEGIQPPAGGEPDRELGGQLVDRRILFHRGERGGRPAPGRVLLRSGERRVGEEGRSRWAPYH